MLNLEYNKLTYLPEEFETFRKTRDVNIEFNNLDSYLTYIQKQIFKTIHYYFSHIE